ncbi:MAG: hypothetical protein QCH31_02205 [Methanolobus sp.]|nr:hypothetical protein [Methanolobus sp.]
MSKKWILIIVVLLQSCLIITASAQSSFSNEIHIDNDGLDFIIYEKYSGTDAEGFRHALDIDGDGFVNSTEVDIFIDSLKRNRVSQYNDYIVIDSDETELSIESFDVVFGSAEGAISDDDMYVNISISYDMAPSFLSGTHNIWVLGHPAIDNMRITLPYKTLLLSYGGIEDSLVIVDSSRTVIEGSSGIRSFMNDGNQTFEYAVSLDIRVLPFMADLSRFNYFFSSVNNH